MFGTACRLVVSGFAATAFTALSLPAQENPKIGDQPKPAPAPEEPKKPTPPAAEEPKKTPPPAAETAKPPSRDEVVAQDVEKAVKLLGSENYLESEEAKSVILELGVKALPHLLKTLEEGNPETKFLICEILGNLRNGSAVTSLIKILNSKDLYGASLSSAAARALGRIGDERAIPELIKALESERVKTDIELRYEAVRALGALRAMESENVLKKFIEDRAPTMNNRIVACAAIEAIGKIRAKALIPDIAGKLTDKASEAWSGKTVEIYAAKALETITGVTRGPIWESTDKQTQETLKKWSDWWTEESKKSAEKPSEKPKEPEKPLPQEQPKTPDKSGAPVEKPKTPTPPGK